MKIIDFLIKVKVKVQHLL